MNWDADFGGLPPIELRDGRKLETLSDCRDFILTLPEAEQPRWERTVALLLKAAEQNGGWCFLARVSFSRTLHGIEGVGAAPVPQDKGGAWPAKRAKRTG